MRCFASQPNRGISKGSGAGVSRGPSASDDVTFKGTFAQILPFLDQDSLYQCARWDQPPTSFANQILGRTRLKVFACSSASGERALNDLATQWGGDWSPGNNSWRADYVTASWVEQHSGRLRGFGSVRLRVADVPECLLAEATDGLSNTFFYHESAGTVYVSMARGEPTDIHKSFQPARITTIETETDVFTWQSTTTASNLAYEATWNGLVDGTLTFYDSLGNRRHPDKYGGPLEWANLTNRMGQPFSFHADGVYFSMLDGSTRFVTDDTDAEVMLSMYSIGR
jgi:hypothetical protein